MVNPTPPGGKFPVIEHLRFCWSAICQPPRSNGMSGGIVGMPCLRLECKKRGDPLVGRRKVQYQAAILPYAIVLAIGGAVALIHMDVVDAIAGLEVEHLVSNSLLGPPTLAEGVHQSIGFVDRAFDVMLDAVAEIVVRPRQIRR